MSDSSLLSRPPYDPEVTALLPPGLRDMLPTDRESIAKTRAFFQTIGAATKEKLQADSELVCTERVISGPGVDLPVVVLETSQPNSAGAGARPGIYHIHGGGMVAGDRYGGLDLVADWVKNLGAVAVAVEYRLPPEHPHPAPVDDCYAGLLWMAANASSLNIDPERIMMEGQSAGGGLAAATALMARDKGGPKLCAQLLGVPLLDNRGNSKSCLQFFDGESWSGKANRFAWHSLLGDAAGGEGVSYYASPARATDLSRLPAAFIDVSSTEPSREEAVAYAQALWRSGVQAELHVWPGGPHAFDVLAPAALVSQTSSSTRSAWVHRMLREKAV